MIVSALACIHDLLDNVHILSQLWIIVQHLKDLSWTVTEADWNRKFGNNTEMALCYTWLANAFGDTGWGGFSLKENIWDL
jgi:hypothetical protein